jgi:hypothetical protein
MKNGDYNLQSQNAWENKRDNITATETDLTATTSKWSSLMTNFKAAIFEVDEKCDRVKVRFRFTNSAANAGYKIYALQKDDDAFPVCDGVAYAGTQEATVQIDSGTTYHVDRITVANDYWLLSPRSSCEDAAADNMSAMLAFSNFGTRKFLVIITSISAGGVSVDMASYKG